MNLDQYLDALRGNRAFMSCVTHWKPFLRAGCTLYGPSFGPVCAHCRSAEKARVISSTHQRQAVDAAHLRVRMSPS